MQRSPIYFCEKIWALTPQPVKEEHRIEVERYIRFNQWNKIKVQHFDKFIKGKHITWQQWLLLKAVEDAELYGKNKISVVAGHGVGKSSTLAWLIIWYLFCHYDAQIGATAPTSEQMHDVLWKEVKVWMDKMPSELADLFEWQSGYIRVKEKPETWFARARTARKEAPEAIAGLHGDYVMIIGDESSGIPDEIFRSAEGSMTGPNVLVLLIGNGTRGEGYFYETHHDDKENWQVFQFSSGDSPIVEDGYIERMEAKYGRESDEFKIRVSGGFPSMEAMDDKGWIPLVVDVRQVSEETLLSSGRKVMGVDPAGEGDDLTVWVIRDNFMARVVATEAESTEKTVAAKTLDLMREHEIAPSDVIVDSFGIGANVSKELLLIDHTANVTSINWGEEAGDANNFLNKRAECCFAARDWFMRGGVIVGDELKKEILAYQYRNTLSGKKQILDKVKLRKKLGKSPDRGDAFYMTFYNGADLLLGSEYSHRFSVKKTSEDIFNAI